MTILWNTIALAMVVKLVHAVGCVMWSIGYVTRTLPPERARGSARPRIWIVIPLLREQRVLPAMFDRFLGLLRTAVEDIVLVLVTTEREIVEAGDTRTGTTVEHLELLMLNHASDALLATRRVIHLHYPTVNSGVSEQLNYAFRYIANLDGPPLSERYMLLYNADSVVDPEGLSALSSAAAHGTPVAQQSALFLANVPELLAAGKFYLAAHGLRQSRWTLQHELPRYLWSRLHLSMMPAWLERMGLVHCVGHGLLIRCDVLGRAGGFPLVEVGLEDLALGWVLKAIGYHVEPIPVLENAETPHTLRILWLQKASWFLGPLGYFNYWRLLPKSEAASASKLAIASTTAQGITDAANWIFGGPFVVLLLVVGHATGHFGTALGLYVAYVYIPLAGVLWLWGRLPSATFPRATSGRLFCACLVFFVVPVLHSAPAFHGLWWAIKSMSGQALRRPKTER